MTVSNTALPVITGTAQVGQTLHTDNGQWTYDLDYLSYAYRWLRCDAIGANCVAITNATANSYVPQSVDIGSTLRSEVTATEHASPPAPSCGPWDPPLTITTGGTYTGSWESTSAGTAAVTIATNQPVTITGCIRNLVGPCLTYSVDGVQLTLSHCFFFGGTWTSGPSPRAVFLRNFKSFTMENCTIDKTGGIDLRVPQASSSILITKNEVTNIQNGSGQTGGNLRQFVQLNTISTATIEISWNQVIQTYGQSLVEDNISAFMTSNAYIHDNYIEGSGGNTGSGITVGDGGGSNNTVDSNQLVGIYNVGLGLAGGHNNILNANRLISDGQPASSSHAVGVAVNNWNNDPTWAGNQVTNNYIGWQQQSGVMNNTWYGTAPAASTGNTLLSGPITGADETAEFTYWTNKLASNGITIGA